MQVKDLEAKEYLTMTTDPYEINEFFRTLTKKEKNKMMGDIGTLWVDVRDGDYGEAYYCLYSVPFLNYEVYLI